MRFARRFQLILLLPVVVLAAASASAQESPEAARLVVEVTGMRNAHGSVRCTLHGGPRQFPEGSADVVRRVRVENDGHAARCVFEGLAPWHTYAVVIHHDEDDDSLFARGFLGVPLEGYGFSNNVRPVLAPPSFDECSVHLHATELRLAITMRY